MLKMDKDVKILICNLKNRDENFYLCTKMVLKIKM